jgi:aspartate aminotransferase-like enzyme
LRALGADLWIESEPEASTLVTAVRGPVGEVDRIVARARSFGANASPGFGVVSERLIRLDHTGRRATDDTVLANLLGYALAVGKTLDVGEIGAILGAGAAPT